MKTDQYVDVQSMAENSKFARLDPHSRPLIFLHIGKTAGTTFNSMLSWQYQGVPSYWFGYNEPNGENLATLPIEERLRLRLVRGHMNFGVHKLLAPESQYITFVRDPVKRLLSYYRHGKREAQVHSGLQSWWYDAMRSWSIEQFLESRRDTEFDNGQVRWISGLGTADRPCRQDDLEQAKENLRTRFLVVGVTERFDESVLLMSRILRWRRPLAYRRENVAKGGNEVGRATIERLREFNSYDAALYDFACEELERQVSEVRDFSRHLASLKRRNCFISFVPTSVYRLAKGVLKVAGRAGK